MFFKYVLWAVLFAGIVNSQPDPDCSSTTIALVAYTAAHLLQIAPTGSTTLTYIHPTYVSSNIACPLYYEASYLGAGIRADDPT